MMSKIGLPGTRVHKMSGGSTKSSNPKDLVGIRKAPMTTVPMSVMGEVGLAMLEGARKYGRHNYRVVGVAASTYIDAAMRHIRAFWDLGRDIDPDSGLPELTKAIASLVVVRDAMIQGKLIDDRPPPVPKGFFEELNRLASELIDRYPEAKQPYTAKELKK